MRFEQGLCAREQAQRLVGFDHHRAGVRGRVGVMLTYQRVPIEQTEGPLWLRVVYRYAASHPPVPPEIQELIDRLCFRASQTDGDP